MPEGEASAQPGRAEREDVMLRLFDEHYVPLCRLAFVILGDHALAEEIVMEALLRTFSGWGRLRDPGRADVYLRRAVINLSRTRIRRKILERRVSASLEKRRVDTPHPDLRENAAVVWAAVRGLPERQRACVVLFYYEDLPESQIAEILDCAVGTVKSQLSKARAKLELALRDDFGGAS
jgi:RNA polymerase sigma-70 factor (sigma-E family)